MIKGAIRKYDFRFESNFIDFLSSLDRASVTYKVDPGTIDHKIDETPDIRFNLQKSADTYASALANRFSKSCNEIEEAVDNIYVKTEKLFLLSRYLIEVESLQHFLSCKESIGYTHKKFTFSNISKEEKYLQVNMDQKDFQEYYFWMDHYLKKNAIAFVPNKTYN